MKKVTKAEDGSFVIGARQNGTESGIKDAELKVADGITATVKPGNGSYGEFLRVDLTGNYGDLGAHMQSVEWAYYGNDSTYTNRLANYGTKICQLITGCINDGYPAWSYRIWKMQAYGRN